MNDDWLWRWVVLRFAESYFTWFWERHGRSWRDNSDAALITLWVWCYVMVLQIIQSFERPEHEEMPTVLNADRAELEGLRESFQRQMPTYDPFAAALGRIQLNSIRQLQNMFKDLQIDPERQLQNMFKGLQIEPASVRQLQNMLKGLQVEPDSVAQLQNMFKGLQMDSVRQLQNMFRGLDIDSVRRLDRYRDL